MENWEKINGVQEMQDYIEEHINDNITLKMLAGASGYSPWYCSRIFKELIGKTPFEYIRIIRLSHAAAKLRDDNAPRFQLMPMGYRGYIEARPVRQI